MVGRCLLCVNSNVSDTGASVEYFTHYGVPLIFFLLDSAGFKSQSFERSNFRGRAGLGSRRSANLPSAAFMAISFETPHLIFYINRDAMR